jgi:hypothetical protein
MWIAPGCVQLLGRERRFHTAWVNSRLSASSTASQLSLHQRTQNAATRANPLRCNCDDGADSLKQVPLALGSGIRTRASRRSKKPLCQAGSKLCTKSAESRGPEKIARGENVSPFSAETQSKAQPATGRRCCLRVRSSPTWRTGYERALAEGEELGSNVLRICRPPTCRGRGTEFQPPN